MFPSPRFTKAQANLIAFLIAIVVILIFVFGIFFAISNVSSPAQHNLDYHSVIQQQVNGGAVLIYYNATSNPFLYVVNSTSGYKLEAVYANEGGVWVQVYNTPTPLSPKEKIYLPAQVAGDEVSLLLFAYNTTQFAFATPNSTVVS
ncbi:hypothetical protein [Sulfuracidifex tepidarius]|uniref:Archaeal Type IV pilin N-terminal domain-containing protein n=1 Tax=Sulfuracidifex tepidarius TaxID=1294262 RepID=A0A510DZD6_9CREN|nr:hypothetical protein [Sulfuracidifex tepidarius]BBG22851.1 hypothetical protein IC006_0135 [Sulfuracidifex tepidarius]BBG25612.1 hypothetical protein IC007_0117 [Sulfuracidifex tepidarius]